MDIKEFAQQFQESVNTAVEMGNGDYDQELASAILEYLEDNGEVNVPEICSFQKLVQELPHMTTTMKLNRWISFTLLRQKHFWEK